MLDLKQLKVQYITNEAGEKTAIILSIEEFEELLEDLEDLAIIVSRQQEPTISHDEVIAGLEQDGILQS